MQVWAAPVVDPLTGALRAGTSNPDCHDPVRKRNQA